MKSKSQWLQKEELRNGQLWFQLLGSRSVEKHTLRALLGQRLRKMVPKDGCRKGTTGRRSRRRRRQHKNETESMAAVAVVIADALGTAGTAHVTFPYKPTKPSSGIPFAG